jgi:hypothetical protein
MGLCDRRAVLSRAGVKGNDPDDETLLKFWIGEVLHEAIQKVLTAEVPDEVIGHEVPVRDEDARVSGKIDSLLRAGTEGDPWELKSVDSEAFKFTEFPKHYHLFQESMYLVYGKFPRGHLAYIGKQDGKIVEFAIELTPELEQYVRGEIAKLDRYLAAYRLNGALPPPINEKPTNWRIAKCEYRKTGLCCGDPENAPGRDEGQRDDAPHGEPSELPRVLPLGLFQLEAQAPLRKRRKSRSPKGERMAQGPMEEVSAG